MASPILQRHIILSPDLPPDTEIQRPSGLFLPAQRHAERYIPAEGGHILSFFKDDIQIVSGTVITSPKKIVHRLCVPRPIAMKFGKNRYSNPNGLVECDFEYNAPAVGDRVFIGYGTWGNAEFSRDVYLLEDKPVGRIETSCIDMFCNSEGVWECPGPWVILEPIPQEVPEDGTFTDVLIAGIMEGVGKVVAVPSYAHMNIPKLGEIVRFVGNTRLATPNPFSQDNYMKISLDNVYEILDYTLDEDQIAKRWEAIYAHNNISVKGIPDVDKRTAEQILEDEVGEAAERAKKIIDKRFKSRRFSKR